MSRAVLDASAVIAVIRKESGFENVSASLNGALLSAVNLAEVLQKLTEDAHEVAMISAVIENLGIETIDFDARMAAGVASLYPVARKGISLADRACIALGVQEQLPVVTGDRKWADLGIDTEIVVFRPDVH